MAGERDADAHRRLAIWDTTTISRRNVEVILPDGKSSYRTDKHRAFQIVKRGEGFWVNEAHSGVQLLAKREALLVRPRQFTKANWEVLESGYGVSEEIAASVSTAKEIVSSKPGLPVWQIVTGRAVMQAL